MSTLGVVVLSMRGMQHLSGCLESVKWADRVTLLHVGEGEPLEGVESFSSLVYRKIASPKELGRLAWESRTDWVLHLWGEERVEEDLGKELRAICREKLAPSSLGYRIPIRSRLLDRWTEGSLLGPSPALRLSRRIEEIPSGWWDSAEDKLQEYPTLRRGWIGDYTAAELRNGVDQIQMITEVWAERLQNKGRFLSPAANVLLPLRVFAKMLLMNGVLSSGFAGLTLSILAAYATLLTGAKIWEASHANDKKKDED